MKIIVSVGVCLRNCESSVKSIVDRISSQDFPHKNIEVLFVEEGSKDDTLSLLKKNAPRMNMPYKIIHQEWKGLGFSRNVIFQNSKGKYIVWVDDGTIIPKDYIRKQIIFMEEHPAVGIAMGVIGIYSGSNLVSNLENMGELVFSYNYAGKVTTKLPGTGGSIYRTKAMKQVNGFDEQITGATEDTDIAYRILSAGWQIWITNTKYFVDHNKKLRTIWSKSLWYGYGSHFTLNKHKELHTKLYKSTPIAGFLQGIFICFTAYKLTHKKTAFLLPFYILIKRTAFCLGFLRGHIDSYGHVKKNVCRAIKIK